MLRKWGRKKKPWKHWITGQLFYEFQILRIGATHTVQRRPGDPAYAARYSPGIIETGLVKGEVNRSCGRIQGPGIGPHETLDSKECAGRKVPPENAKFPIAIAPSPKNIMVVVAGGEQSAMPISCRSAFPGRGEQGDRAAGELE